MSERIAVIGSRSMVGSRFCELAKDNFKIIEADQPGVDLKSEQTIENFFTDNNFDLAILFAAFTDVDEAEKQRNDRAASCWQINVQGTQKIAQACQSHNRHFLFISTDFVFDGTNGPYSEDDEPGPDLEKVSWYGITKIEAEKAVKDVNPDNLIVRIAYPYRGRYPEKDDIVKRILRLARDNQLYPMFADQHISPTFIDDLSPAIKLLVQEKLGGIWHLASPKSTTQYEFAKKVFELASLDVRSIKKGSIVNFLKKSNGTPRPVNVQLRTSKIESLGFVPTKWDDGLEIIFRKSRGQLI